MKTIGLLGGMSWESTAHYYEAINELTKARLGGLHSAPIAMVSLDFAPIEVVQHTGDWDDLADRLITGARQVQAAGAGCLVVCANTAHIVADEIQAAIDIPLLHIADATAQALARDQVTSVGLLGTSFTMEEAFYKDRLAHRYGLDVMVPESSDRQYIHGAIYRELVRGEINDDTRAGFVKIIDALAAQGAKGIILGCTEIGLLVQQVHTAIKLYDTTVIHAEAAVQWALSG
ncbi:MAG TPA: aspartate/glutamate racemase family protein [Pseudomonadales bacterium]|nr:aspartate/glutamate racemase family protein [Pseudomonadales bacterium]